MDRLAPLPRMLRWARRHADMSQRELARWSGVPKSTIADIESGRCRLHVDTAERLLATMGMEVTISRQDRGEMGPLTVDERRDRGGRLVPPHLDVRRRRTSSADLPTYTAWRSGATPLRPPPLTWRRDRDVRNVLRRYGCVGDSPFAVAPRRGDVLDPGVGIADLWLRGWPYADDLYLAGPQAHRRADGDLRRGLRALVRLTSAQSPSA